MEKIGICENCGKEYRRKNARQRFCSELCRVTGQPITDGKKIVRTCQRCGKAFETYASRRKKFCSADCANPGKERDESRDVVVKIRIRKPIPVFPELQPKVGAVYAARKCVGQHVFYIIGDICGKQIVVRNGECVEVG